MKKLLFLFAVSALTFGAQAQDHKKFQVGLTLGPTINSVNTNTNKIERNGIGGGFTVGLASNYMFSPNIGLAFGLQFDLENLKLNYGDPGKPELGDVFYAFDDTRIIRFDEDDQNFDKGEFTDSSAFQLLTRKFRAKYITLPLFLKFQTNQIGKMIIYGKFGLRTSILAGVRMDDEGFASNLQLDANNNLVSFENLNTNRVTMTDMKPDAAKKGLALVRTGVGIYAGTEWNITGNTFLFGELGFNYGFTPVLYQNSSHLVDKVPEGDTNFDYSQLSVGTNPQHIFELKIGVLF